MRIASLLFLFILTATSAAPAIPGMSAPANPGPVTPPPGIRAQVTQTLRKSILREAAWAMQQTPITVTSSRNPRSAGGLHDFSSDADYWWPNPQSPDSPYIEKDGQTNPGNFVAHRLAMIRLSRIVGALASAYVLTGEAKYVRQALRHANAWFIDTATLMNPSLLYSQAVKGKVTGRSWGVIDTIQLMEVAQGLEAMAGSQAMDAALLEKIKAWFSRYLQWLTTHPFGKAEMNAANNHATCWVMQVASFARFTGDNALLNFCRGRYKTVLLPGQMAADGSFPLELKRTKPYGYSIFNLDAMATICQLLSTPHDDLWRYQTPDGRSIEKGVAFLYPYIADKQQWPYRHDTMHWKDWPVAQPFLVFGANVFGRSDWLHTWQRLDHEPADKEVIRNLPVRHPLIWLDRTPVDLPPVTGHSPVDLPQVMAGAEKQTKLLLSEIKLVDHADSASAGASPNTAAPFSPRTIENGQLKLVPSRDWTSGFFPGECWMFYAYTGNQQWRQTAVAFTAAMEREKTNATSHDMGFKIDCSFGNGYRLTKDSAYRDVIIQSARTLAARFNPLIGCIRSWDHHRNLWGFPVIIDNMMNLELLFEATRLTGDSSFYRIAIMHANTTLKNHFRKDYSSFHVVDYDTLTGKVVKKMTWQGYSDSSAWARGQAWGLYAYTMCYRYTNDPVYLRQAEHIAAFILHHPRLPADKIPYWDFDAPGIPAAGPRDASAAAVIASGLYELSTYSRQGQYFRAMADIILVNLTAHYRAAPGSNKGFILLHSTGSKPANSEVDGPLNYADYYYLQALLRSDSAKLE